MSYDSEQEYRELLDKLARLGPHGEEPISDRDFSNWTLPERVSPAFQGPPVGYSPPLIPPRFPTYG